MFQVSEKSRIDMTIYLGRNIGHNDKGFYITFGDRDLTSSHDKDYGVNYFSSHRKAMKALNDLLASGATWFDAHFDPTI